MTIQVREDDDGNRGPDGRFRKGKSGNPSGRKPKAAQPRQVSPGFAAGFALEMAEPIKVNMDGRTVEMETGRAYAIKLKQDLMGRSIDRYRAFSQMRALGLDDALCAIHDHFAAIAEEEARFQREQLDLLFEQLQSWDEYATEGLPRYDFAKAVASCKCGCLDPWREQYRDDVREYEMRVAATKGHKAANDDDESEGTDSPDPD